MFIKLGDDKIMGVAGSRTRTAPTRRARPRRCSSCISRSRRAQIEKFRTAGATVILGMDHPNYAHMAVMPDAVRKELAGDFD